MARLFGTDGVRGVANSELTAELALSLSAAAARTLCSLPAAVVGENPQPGQSRKNPLAVVGRDPRPSGEFLEAAVVAGLAAEGVDVLRVGIVPTPAVAFLVGHLGADLGVMLSASHNPMPDNGIKFFSAGGHKLTDAQEDAIEALAMAGAAATSATDGPRPTGAQVGRIRDGAHEAAAYGAHLIAHAPHRLDGLTVVVDCANGAASNIAPEVLQRLGARVITLFADTSGVHINDGCGSTHPEALQAAVIEHGADAGIAHDGDADRCLAVDATGELINGDAILAMLALAMHERGQLAHATLVATVMSNMALRLALAQRGISVVETAVGDRYVLQAMAEGGFSLGGEQSGHVVMGDIATTGDGLLTAIHVLGHMAQTGRSLADLASVVEPLPQVLLNVSGVDRAGLADNTAIAEEVAAVLSELEGRGRVLLRPSGTEPVVRVMVEAPTTEQANAMAQRLADRVRTELAP